MDVDNSSENQSGGIELEQSLLQQFSCLGTTDRDELIKQLQKLLGSSLNWETAAFFLDMNNWNLQAAICSYFDIEAPTNLPSMNLIVDYPPGESGVVPVNTRFKKTWEVQNNGQERWPDGCVLQNTGGERFQADHRIPVGRVMAGEIIQISVDMLSPYEPGMYQSKWRMCTEQGCYFGDTIVSIISVVDQESVQLSEQLQTHLTDLGRSPPPAVVNPFGSQRVSSQNGDSVQTPNNSQDSDMNIC